MFGFHQNEIEEFKNRHLQQIRQGLKERHAELRRCFELFGSHQDLTNDSCSAERELFYSAANDYCEFKADSNEVDTEKLVHMTLDECDEWLQQKIESNYPCGGLG